MSISIHILIYTYQHFQHQLTPPKGIFRTDLYNARYIRATQRRMDDEKN